MSYDWLTTYLSIFSFSPVSIAWSAFPSKNSQFLYAGNLAAAFDCACRSCPEMQDFRAKACKIPTIFPVIWETQRAARITVSAGRGPPTEATGKTPRQNASALPTDTNPAPVNVWERSRLFAIWLDMSRRSLSDTE